LPFGKRRIADIRRSDAIELVGSPALVRSGLYTRPQMTFLRSAIIHHYVNPTVKQLISLWIYFASLFAVDRPSNKPSAISKVRKSGFFIPFSMSKTLYEKIRVEVTEWTPNRDGH